MTRKMFRVGKSSPWFRLCSPQNRRRTRRSGTSFLGALALLITWGLPSVSEGAGFALMQQGTGAMAQGNAFVAEADDPSAIFYNPAGLNQLKRPQVYLGTFINYPNREYHGSGGDFSATRPRFYESASIYLVYPTNERVALGLGYFSPFGLGTDWPASWTGRYITTYSRLKTYNVNPVISLKLTKNFSLAGGLDFLWSDVRLRRNLQVLPFRDGKSDLKGSGSGIGANFGFLYEPLQGVKLGVAYRTHIQVNHEGSLQLTLPAAVSRVSRDMGGAAKITYPPSLTCGVSVNRFQPFTFNVDATWTGWSTYKDLQIWLNRGIILNGRLASSVVTPKNWHDAWAFRFGANWRINEKMKVRAGYTYDRTPVPDSTMEPQVPDANRHVFAVGADLKIWKLTLGIAYNFILNETRHKDNLFTFNGVPLPLSAQANGRFQTYTHSLGLSSMMQF